jgi:Cd2+/Zn2+-exporting ATPase
MTDDIGRVPWLISHSRRAMSIIRQNIAISLVTKAAFVVATAFGMASMWGAIAADVGVSLLVVANALRLLNGHRAESPPQSGDRVSDRLTEGALAHGH